MEQKKKRNDVTNGFCKVCSCYNIIEIESGICLDCLDSDESMQTEIDEFFEEIQNQEIDKDDTDTKEVQ